MSLELCGPAMSATVSFQSHTTPAVKQSAWIAVYFPSTSSWRYWLLHLLWLEMCWCAGLLAWTAISRPSPTTLWCPWQQLMWPWASLPSHLPSLSAQAFAVTSTDACSLPALSSCSHRVPSSACWQSPSIATSPSRSHSGEFIVAFSWLGAEIVVILFYTFVTQDFRKSQSNIIFLLLTFSSSSEHYQGWYPVSGDIFGFHTSGSHWLQRSCSQILKMTM